MPRNDHEEELDEELDDPTPPEQTPGIYDKKLFSPIKKKDVHPRLVKYLDNLKRGMGRRAAASKAEVAYVTITKLRADPKWGTAFQEVEAECEGVADADIDDALFQTATSGNVGAIALFHKIRRGWVEHPSTAIQVNNNTNGGPQQVVINIPSNGRELTQEQIQKIQGKGA